MADNNHDLPNPFLAARGRASIDASIQVHDVHHLRPEWSEAQARLFLEQNALLVADAMLRAGTQALREILEAQNNRR